MLHKLTSISIKQQIKIISIFSLSLFMILLTFIFKSTKYLLYDNENNHANLTIERLQNEMDLIQYKANTYSMNLEKNKIIEDLLLNGKLNDTKLILSMLRIITEYKILEPFIVDIALINDDFYYSTIYSRKKLLEMRNTVKNDTFVFMGGFEQEFISLKDRNSMIVFAKNCIYDNKNAGTIIISVDSDIFSVETSDCTKYWLVGNTEKALSFNSHNIQNKETIEIYEKWKENGDTYNFTQLPYIINSVYLKEIDSWILSSINTKQISGGTSNIQILIWSCVILTAFWSIIIFLVLNIQVVNPLRTFYNKMEEIRCLGKRNIDDSFSLSGCKEIKKIGDEFKVMMHNINDLHYQIFKTATDLYEIKVQKQNAELAYYKSQIDPHFLYNTLEVVRKIALEKKVSEIAQISLDMANIFRYSSKGNDFVTLNEEISIIKSYMRIQQTRFSDKIDVYYFVAEEALTIMVPKMLLQPIVENSVFHGLESKPTKGNLFIGVNIENNTLKITVKDDGVGIDKEKLEEYKSNLLLDYPDTSKHVGILNTNARIRLLYGKDYGVKIDSEINLGTTVTISLPIKK